MHYVPVTVTEVTVTLRKKCQDALRQNSAILVYFRTCNVLELEKNYTKFLLYMRAEVRVTLSKE
jgi:hypothetical protein